MINYNNIEINNDWAFSEYKRKETTYLTHGIHSYPAKYIPQLVNKLLITYSKENDLILDPFNGSGTTLLESVLNHRKAYGSDLNPIANLISEVKTTLYDTNHIKELIINYNNYITQYNINLNLDIPESPKIDFWFHKNISHQLAYILKWINNLDEDIKIKNLLKVGFSQILKSCSVWRNNSNKPVRQLDKKISDPFNLYLKELNKFIKIYNELNNYIIKHNIQLDGNWNLQTRDSKSILLNNSSVDLIITSPPYATSYEYADLHQLSLIWLNMVDNYKEFKNEFIGTGGKNLILDVNSNMAYEIINKVYNKMKSNGKKLSTYFYEMNEIWKEMIRIMKPNATISIIVGNTILRGENVLNAEIFSEQLENLGLKKVDVIKRQISAKNLPTTRDASTGRLAKISNNNLILTYPTEYILIYKKTTS